MLATRAAVGVVGLNDVFARGVAGTPDDIYDAGLDAKLSMI